jgi:hypothetical protein
MRNDDDCAGPITNGDGETSESLTIQEVTGLVQDTDLWVVPQACSDDKLDLLAYTHFQL